MKKIPFFFLMAFLIFVSACKKDNADKNQMDPQLVGHWKFVGFINTNKDTTFVSLHSDCDSCMSLFISSKIYYGRSYLNQMGKTAFTKNNQLTLISEPDQFDITYPEGPDERKFYESISTPNVWKVSNKYLLLTTTQYPDTLLFIAE